MTVRLEVLALPDAKPGTRSELGAFLDSGRRLAAAEPGTVTWVRVRDSRTPATASSTPTRHKWRSLDPATPDPKSSRSVTERGRVSPSELASLTPQVLAGLVTGRAVAMEVFSSQSASSATCAT
jgi:hypothetical protein